MKFLPGARSWFAKFCGNARIFAAQHPPTL
jgi:hypothetical protein